jgi:signal transduction histidine kinase
MMFMRLELEMLESRLDGHPARERLASIRHVMERTIADIRRAIAALSPTILERYGLAAAIRRLALNLDQAGICVTLRLPKRFPKLPESVAIVLYRVLQESCSNILKHAGAKTVKIHLKSADKGTEMTVIDDGCGFTPPGAMRKHGSYGLSGMAERVALVGGRFEIDSQPTHGATIRVLIPATEEKTIV